MKAKCFTTLLISFLSILAFAVEINHDTLKNPPSWVEVTDYKDGDFCWAKSEWTQLTFPEQGSISVLPRISYIGGKYYCQVQFTSSVDTSEILQFVSSSNKVISLKITSKPKINNLYYTIGYLPIVEYYQNLVLAPPAYIRVKITQLSSQILEFPMAPEWKQSFQDMKVFFKDDTPVLKFLGIPIQGSMEDFVEKLKAKGYKQSSKADEWHGMIGVTMIGNFWKFKNCKVSIRRFSDRSEISSVVVSVDHNSGFMLCLDDVVKSYIEKYGQPKDGNWIVPGGIISINAFSQNQYSIFYQNSYEVKRLNLVKNYDGDL